MTLLAARAICGAVSPKGFRQFFRLAGRAEHVLHADEFDGARARRCQSFGDGAAEPAIDVVIFRRDEGAGFLGAAHEQFRVDRLDRRHVDDAGRNAVGFQHLRRFQRARHFHAAGDDGDVAAVADDLAFADLEGVVFAEHALRRAAAGAHIDGTFEFQDRARGEAGFHRIGGRDHRHAGNGAEGREIFQACAEPPSGPTSRPGWLATILALRRA